MSPRSLTAVLALATAGVLSSPAQADDRPLASSVTLVSDDPCLGGGALVASVRTWLRRDAIDEHVRVLVETAAGAGSVTVLADDRLAAARRFEDLPETCADRRAVLGLAVAIAIDAALVDRLAPPAVEPVRVAPEAPAPEPAPPTPETPSPPTRAAEEDGVGVLLGAEGGVALGVMPEPVARVSVLGGVTTRDGLSIVVAADGTSPVTRALGSGTLEAMIAAGRAQACLVRGDATLELGGCLALSVGALLARGRGYARSFDIALPWLATAARVEAIWWISPSAGVSLGVEALVPFPRQHLDVTDSAGQVLATETLPPAAVVVSAGTRFRVGP